MFLAVRSLLDPAGLLACYIRAGVNLRVQAKYTQPYENQVSPFWTHFKYFSVPAVSWALKNNHRQEESVHSK